MISKLKARLRKEWSEVGPFIVAGLREFLLDVVFRIGLFLIDAFFLVVLVLIAFCSGVFAWRLVEWVSK